MRLELLRDDLLLDEVAKRRVEVLHIALVVVSAVVVAFSTSGSSKNVVSALKEARKRGLKSVAFVGYDGGEIAERQIADHVLTVRSDYIPRIQEIHATLYHVLREEIEEAAD